MAREYILPEVTFTYDKTKIATKKSELTLNNTYLMILIVEDYQ